MVKKVIIEKNLFEKILFKSLHFTFLNDGFFFSCAQGDKNWILDQKDSSSKTEIASKENFYDALRFRTDLKLNSNKRILFTSIKNIEEFKQKYKQTDMTLDYVIRDRLHTAIFFRSEKKFPSVHGWFSIQFTG